MEHLFGSPCKTCKYGDVIYGRYVGISASSTNDDRVLLICTPHNSILHISEEDIDFELTKDDVDKLISFEEDATDAGEWYHANRKDDEILFFGVLMNVKDIKPLATGNIKEGD